MNKKKHSEDEQQEAIYQWFKDNEGVYNFAQLEKQFSFNTKDLKNRLETLIVEEKIRTDKFGTTQCYWYFSLSSSDNLVLLNNLASKIELGQNYYLKVLVDLKKAEYGKEPSEARTIQLNKLNELKTLYESLLQEEAKYQGNDPEMIQELENKLIDCQLSANRWYEGIHAFYSLAKNRGADITLSGWLKQFNLPDDIEEIPVRKRQKKK